MHLLGLRRRNDPADYRKPSMNADQCCTGECLQGRDCPLQPDPSVKRHIAAYVFGSVIACCVVYGLGLMQTMDEHDAQTAVHQVMACSEFPVECRAFSEMHAARSSK